MIDLYTQQNQIKDYIKIHYAETLKEYGLEDVNAYVDDFLDLDKYTKSSQLFFDFGNYNFSNLSNESNTEEITLNVYLTFRNGKAENLSEKLLRYTTAFYEMFEKSGNNFNELADFGIIDSITLYQAAEGNVNVKVADIQIKLQTER